MRFYSHLAFVVGTNSATSVVIYSFSLAHTTMFIILFEDVKVERVTLFWVRNFLRGIFLAVFA